MNLPRILFKGNFKYSDVIVDELSHSGRKTHPEIEAEIEKSWKDMLIEAKAQNQRLWDSTLYRFEGFSVQNSQLKIRLSTIPFRVVKGMNRLIGKVQELGEECFSMGTFASGAVITKDDKYILGNVGVEFFKSIKISLPGGVLSKDEQVVTDGDSLFQSFRKELLEEVNIKENDISEIKLIGAISTERLKVGFFFQVKLNISGDTVLKRFKDRKDLEFSSLLLLKKEEFVNELRKSERQFLKIFPKLLGE